MFCVYAVVTGQQVAKLRLQKYLAGIPAAFKISSNLSFFSPASLLVFMSETIKDRVFGWTASTSSGIGRILFPLKYWAYFSTQFPFFFL